MLGFYPWLGNPDFTYWGATRESVSCNKRSYIPPLRPDIADIQIFLITPAWPSILFSPIYQLEVNTQGDLGRCREGCRAWINTGEVQSTPPPPLSLTELYMSKKLTPIMLSYWLFRVLSGVKQKPWPGSLQTCLGPQKRLAVSLCSRCFIILSNSIHSSSLALVSPPPKWLPSPLYAPYPRFSGSSSLCTMDSLTFIEHSLCTRLCA